MVHHVINRAAGRTILFESASDYIAFERLLSQAQQRTAMPIIAYCLMPNHWHLLLWPEKDGAVTLFMHWLTTTHARRWAMAHDAVGRGAVYQGRFKNIAVQSDSHLLTVWRYVERNPLRANLVSRAETWPWSSLSGQGFERERPVLGPTPVPRPENWVEHVNAAQTDGELGGIRQSLENDAPYGDVAWRALTAGVSSWRARGRPKRREKGPYPFFE
jgi:putative transposase